MTRFALAGLCGASAADPAVILSICASPTEPIPPPSRWSISRRVQAAGFSRSFIGGSAATFASIDDEELIRSEQHLAIEWPSITDIRGSLLSEELEAQSQLLGSRAPREEQTVRAFDLR